MSRYRMVYIPRAGQRPHSLPISANTARDATILAEKIADVAKWVLLTVKNERKQP